MKDRIIKGNGKSSNLFFNLDGINTFDEFKSANTNGTLQADVTANNSGTGTDEVGTPLSKANLMSDATATVLNLGADATPNDALNDIATRLNPTTYTEPTLKSANATWVAPSNGILSAIVVGSSGSTASYYLYDTTLGSTYAVMSTQATAGGRQTGCCGIIKGHTYKVATYSNISTLTLRFMSLG